MGGGMHLTCVLAGWLSSPNHTVSTVFFPAELPFVVTGSLQGHLWIWRCTSSITTTTTTTSTTGTTSSATSSATTNGTTAAASSPAPGTTATAITANSSTSATTTMAAASSGGGSANAGTGTTTHAHMDHFHMEPYLLLLGHRQPITAILETKHDVDMVSTPVIISASKDGELNMWNLADGRCVVSNTEAFDGIPTNLKLSSCTRWILCSGQSSEMRILNAATLEVVSSIRQHDNWLSSACLYPEPEGKDTLFTLTLDGMLRAWSFSDAFEKREMANLRTTSIGVPFAKHLSINPFDTALMMVITKEKCMIFNVGDFGLLLTIPCPSPLGWSGGTFVDVELVLLWTKSGKGYLFQLPRFHETSTAISQEKRLTKFGSLPRLLKYDSSISPKLLYIFSRSDYNGYHPSCMSYVSPKSGDASKQHSLLAFGIHHGRTLMSVWSFRIVSLSTLRPNEPPSEPVVLNPFTERFIDELWFSGTEPSTLRPPEMLPSAVGVIRERWFVQGFSNGVIRYYPIENFGSHNRRPDRTLKCSDLPSRVTCFHGSSTKPFLIAGYANGTVRIWNLETGKLVYTVKNHSMEVISFVTPPADMERMRACVCSIGKDNSLAIISLDELKCLYLFGGHLFDIVSLHWRKKDDFFIVACTDGSVYVWQLGTGHLDRRATGQIAADIVDNCDFHTILSKEKDFRQPPSQAVESLSVLTHGTDNNITNNPQIQMLMINVRRLISDYNASCHSPASPTADGDATAETDRNVNLALTARTGKGRPSLFGGGAAASAAAVAGNLSFADDDVSDFPVNSPLGFSDAATDIRRSHSNHDMAAHQRQVPSTPTPKVGHSTTPRHSLLRASSMNELDKGTRSIAVNCPPEGADDQTSSRDSIADPGLTMGSRIGLLASNNRDDDVNNSSNREGPSTFRADDEEEDDDSAELTLAERYHALVRILLSSLLAWTAAPQIDQICQDWIGLKPLPSHISFGFKSFNGNIAIFAPDGFRSGVDGWDVSHNFTALRLLTIVSLSQALMSNQRGLEEELIHVTTHYATLLPDFVKNFKIPSVTLLAKFWQDQLSEIQQAARSLFLSAITKMPSQDRQALVEYWVPNLLYGNSAKKAKPISVIVLGALGSEIPDYLPVDYRQQTASSLFAMMTDESRGMFCVAATELLGRGYATWKPYLQSQGTIKTLFYLAYPSVRRSSSSRLSLPRPVNAFPHHLPTSHPSSSTFVSSSSSGTGPVAVPSHRPSTPPDASSSAHPEKGIVFTDRNLQTLVSKVSKQSLVLVAAAVPDVFVKVIATEMMESNSISDRVGAMRIISLVVKKRPLVCYKYLNTVVKAVVQCLDPNHQSLREAILSSATAVLHQMVVSYPALSFHDVTQRLAVGTDDSYVVIYDLRTATRWQVLEGHKGSITACSFSKDGRYLVSFSIVDSTIRIWQTNHSILGVFNAAPKCAGVQKVTQTLGHKPVHYLLESVRFEWDATGRRVVLLNGNEKEVQIDLDRLQA